MGQKKTVEYRDFGLFLQQYAGPVRAFVVLLILAAGAAAFWSRSGQDGEITIDPADPDIVSVEQDRLASGPEAIPAGNTQSAVTESLKEGIIIVDVAGAVETPMVLSLPAGSRVYQAVASAGGLRADADMRNINQAASLQDGDRLYIPSRQETTAQTVPPPSAGMVSASENGSAGTQNRTGEKKININTADAAALQQLSGVGPATAQKIIEDRNANGRFAAPEDLKRVSGIGEKTFERLKAHITV